MHPARDPIHARTASPHASPHLQVVPWLTNKMGLRRLDDSDENVYVYDDPAGKERFILGVYVDT